MQILIVGAGIAGLMLAALLKQRGITPIVVEKAESLGEIGYMMGLYPIGANVLRAIDSYEQYLDSSVAGKQYEAYTEDAQLIKQFSFTPIVDHYGAYQLISRYQLLEIIQKACDNMDILFNTQVTGLQQHDNKVDVTFSNNQQASFDLVVGADGLHSHIRSLILSANEYEYFSTGWGGWVWWCQENSIPANTIQEFWGNGTFFGAYPIKGKVGVVAAVDSPSEELALGGQSRQEYIKNKFTKLISHQPGFFAELPGNDKPVFFWSLNDQKSKIWYKGRVVLLGDSATAFLPTAGVGASMALESAAALDDILSRTGEKFIPHALAMFEKRRKKRVEGVQADSRRLAKMMFVNASWKVWLRNTFTKSMSAESLLKSIIKGFDEPI